MAVASLLLTLAACSSPERAAAPSTSSLPLPASASAPANSSGQAPATGVPAGGTSAASEASGSSAGTRATVRVPEDAATIGAAVALVAPGGLVLIGPGEYHEQVTVRTPRVTVRGTDRNRVVVDGDVLRPNGIVLTAAGDAVQNLTVRNATLNGILVTGEVDADGNGIGHGSAGYTVEDSSAFPPLQGFLVDHVTAYNNGLYGIYAFDAQHGMIRDSYTSGMADSGIYVGQCKPCDVGVTGNVAERNAVGYEGTNASGEMYVYANRFVGNRVGATTDSDHQEALLPQVGAVMIGNLIAANNQAQSPEQADGGWGIGLGIAGGTENLVQRNRIEANTGAGLIITNTVDLPPVGNQVVDNTFSGNAVDIAYTASSDAKGKGNCLQGNTLRSVRPITLPRRCPAANAVAEPVALRLPDAPAGIAFTEVPAPPSQPSLPATGTPAVAGGPGSLDLASIPLPAPSLLAARSAISW